VASDVDFLPDLIKFLAKNPDRAGVCQFIALNWPGSDPIHRVALLEVEQDASVRVTGWFGFNSDVLEPFERTSLWDELPVSVAIREHRTLMFSDATALDREFPRLNGNGLQVGSLVVTPIISAGQAIGACSLIGDDGIPALDEHAELLQSVCLVLGLYLLSRSLKPEAAAQQLRAPRAPAAEHAHVPLHLSARQHTVLSYLEQRLTNRQIAARMGFSESTIRQETMAIYRFLDVAGRHEAVEVARARGLLEHEDDRVIEVALVSSVR
jgi:DNA-binding CsgD family transcriptional regulator